MYGMYGTSGLGSQATEATAAALPACLENVPFGLGIRQVYFRGNGRYSTDSKLAVLTGIAQSVDQHLKSACFGNDVGSSQYAQMYVYALIMLANQKIECELAETDYEQEIATLDQENDALRNQNDTLRDQLAAAQDALASGGNCPPAVNCPPPPAPIVCAPATVRKEENQALQEQCASAQQSKWGVNLGWAVGGAVVGAGGYFLLRGK